MKTAIQKRATELGFDACQFTTAQPPAHGKHFQNWLTAQHHGEMNYLPRNADKRLNPQQVLAEAQSIISLAVSYENSNFETPNSKLNGVVARYARFSDYHQLMGERLKQLTRFVNQLSPENTRSLWYVDTGPMLERDFAQRAGLGFIGKHTNLISRKLGNWIFLSEIITTLKLEPDLPEKNRCGSCVRCISACPTQAIIGPFQLDARRCISYLTIELKGSIPLEFRSAIGSRIYGCDDCLAVCPWNKFAREGKLMKSHQRNDLEQPDLLELLSLDEIGFKKRFAGTPILRVKRRGLLRNVCVALGNSGDHAAVPALKIAAHDSELLIAEHASWALSEIERSE
ncbi:MAG: tRNA epoxyqueuosine(34) reductase QueG [Verrucomicrobiota bacterium]|nr:tRNA epoxyqueuosine(34) reductase QueG [Verrucomicrobiota bacterium]